jgi:tRNA-Thr(GGU) m(6)t(6)A37 methyltransferase TsaA
MIRVVSVVLVVLTSVLCAHASWEGKTLEVHPIGQVVKDSGKTFIEVYPPYQDGLLGLDGFSHVIVFYWFDRNDTPEKRKTLQVHPRADARNPLTGVFGTRSPRRPNLVGFTICKIESIKDGKIQVESIDAFDNTPVIDLKPYIPESDAIPRASIPAWVNRFRKNQ